MSMRVTTAAAFNAGIGKLQTRQRELSDAQDRMTAGKRVLRASDDPASAARAERALVNISRAEADQRALQVSQNAMTLTEAALGDGAELMQQARELMVQAGNAAYSAGERKAIGVQLSGIRTQLLAVASRKDDSGDYLFFPEWKGTDGPIDGGSPPVFRGAPGVPQVERSNAAREAMPLNVDGLQAWRIDPVSGESLLLKGLDDSIALLNTTSVPMPPAADIARAGITDIDTSLNTLQGLRARVGELMNRGDMIGDRLIDTKLSAQTDRSNAEDLDMVQAISEFQNKQSSYDAALKTYSMVQRMSLFQYLSP